MGRAAALGLLILCAACASGAPGSAPVAVGDRSGPADLAVSYTATPGASFEIGKWYRRWARYDLRVTNRGSGTARATVLTVTFSDGRPQPLALPVDAKAFAMSAGTCEARNGPRFTPGVACRLGDIAPGGTVTVEVGARAHYTGSLHATVAVTSPAASATADNTATTETSLTCTGCGGK